MNLCTHTHTFKWLEREYWENFPLIPPPLLQRKVNLIPANFSYVSYS